MDTMTHKISLASARDIGRMREAVTERDLRQSAARLDLSPDARDARMAALVRDEIGRRNFLRFGGEPIAFRSPLAAPAPDRLPLRYFAVGFVVAIFAAGLAAEGLAKARADVAAYRVEVAQ